MSFISVSHLNKSFKVAKRDSGLKNAIKSFFKREYDYIDAVKDVSFKINKGEIVGYIGPNGAGKSTTIKMLCGILIPDSGKISVAGYNPFKERRKYVSNIGVVFGQRSQLAWDIPAEDSFDLLRDIYKIPKDKYQKNKLELIKLLQIEDVIKRPLRVLSLGQRMRCEIAASLLHSPKILFLDEPTIGLDASSKVIVRDFIKKINREQKVTVILTTHDMTDLESLAKRVILIGKGKILFDGTINYLKQKYGNIKTVQIETNDKITDIKVDGVMSFEKNSNGYTFIVDTRIITVSEFLNYLSKNYNINDVEIDNESLDNIVIKLYKDYKL